MDTHTKTNKTTPIPGPTTRKTPPEDDWKLLQYFNFYRLAIAATGLGIAIFAGNLPPYGSSDPGLFLYSSLTYLIIGLFAYRIIRSRNPDCQTQAGVYTFADVTFLTLLIHASGGLASGLGLLLMVAVAGGSLVLGQRMTVFYASLAALAALLQHGWGWLTGADINANQVFEGFPRVGLLGIGLYVTSALGYGIAQRLRATEALAERRGLELVNLAHINELIIQRMQMGVLLCDTSGRIGLINERGRVFLGLSKNTKNRSAIGELAPELMEALKQWLESPGNQLRRPFRSKTGYMLLPRFVMLGSDAHNGILIFLNDTALLKQQAQQLKMAALARLTASIAHEIRNPLGAISNAAQLLAESAGHGSGDQRLIEIISDHSRRMNAIIENITQLSRRDRVNQVQLHLHTWLTEFAEQFADLVRLPPEAVTAHGPLDLVACADPDQLYQIVMNLCQNAMRHSPAFTQGEAPLIRLELGVSPDGLPILDVIDRGSGVPPDLEENIFDPFFTTTPKGTGLGLYIARELSEGNGGQLDYLPGEKHGARFRATLARAEECSESGY